MQRSLKDRKSDIQQITIIQGKTMYLRLNIHNFYIILILLTLSVFAQRLNTSLLWPLPQQFQSSESLTQFIISPCEIRYVIESPIGQYVQNIIDDYQTKVFKCNQSSSWNAMMNIILRNAQPLVPTVTNHQAYTLTLRDNGRWELDAEYYPGFLRGFQTFAQLFEINSRNQYFIRSLPIFITDAPDFAWRGILIDTSRHFLSVQAIKSTIDAMMYSKMNVLHWHIVDEDSFPMQVPTRPELSQFGKLSGTYSVVDVKAIVSYGMTRGIRVIPQIDTPAHSESWGRSEKYKTIALNCNGLYKGQLDPTLPLTWEVLKDVLLYVNSTFQDSYVHFGGDEVTYECWGQRQNIKEYMKEQNISDYFDLSVDFRRRQKKMWREEISKKKKIIYWANEDIDLPLEDDDVIQWWGVSSNVDRLKGRKNEVILSNYDLTYLDKGFGEYDGYFADYYYQHWRMMYAFEPKIENVNVIGGQVCMWDEVGNSHTHQQKVILRANILAERLWNHKVSIKTHLPNIAARLAAQAKRLRLRGFKVSPVTVGLCQEKNMSICFH